MSKTSQVTDSSAAVRKKYNDALTSLSLEGIVPSPELLADFKLLETGKITRKEFVSRGLKRAKS